LARRTHFICCMRNDVVTQCQRQRRHSRRTIRHFLSHLIVTVGASLQLRTYAYSSANYVRTHCSRPPRELAVEACEPGRVPPPPPLRRDRIASCPRREAPAQRHGTGYTGDGVRHLSRRGHVARRAPHGADRMQSCPYGGGVGAGAGAVSPDVVHVRAVCVLRCSTSLQHAGVASSPRRPQRNTARRGHRTYIRLWPAMGVARP
jgi:hypothetical protein